MVRWTISSDERPKGSADPHASLASLEEGPAFLGSLRSPIKARPTPRAQASGSEIPPRVAYAVARRACSGHKIPRAFRVRRRIIVPMALDSSLDIVAAVALFGASIGAWALAAPLPLRARVYLRFAAVLFAALAVSVPLGLADVTALLLLPLASCALMISAL